MININNKPWNKIRFADIQTVLNEADDENFFFEFKAEKVRPESLIKEISAFANTYGGYIFLGIADNKSIEGCTSWTEQRIHNIIFNRISPIPDFDIKKFKHNGKTIYIIKVEAGSMPPYITNTGHIYSRVSSGSFPINDSYKLSQLYIRRQEDLKRLEQKLSIEELNVHHNLPQNLCAYLDMGFEIQCMDKEKIRTNFHNFDFSTIATYLRQYSNEFSISSLGYSYVITLAKLKNPEDGSAAVLCDAAMNSFMIVMPDGSVKLRICLFADMQTGKADISVLHSFRKAFRYIYSQIFQNGLEKNYIYARKFEKLAVIKQFTPYYSTHAFSEFKTYLKEHIAKYGNNLILNGSRTPYNDFSIIDRRYIESFGLKFIASNIIDELFYTAYLCLGYIDEPKQS